MKKGIQVIISNWPKNWFKAQFGPFLSHSICKKNTDTFINIYKRTLDSAALTVWPRYKHFQWKKQTGPTVWEKLTKTVYHRRSLCKHSTVNSWHTRLNSQKLSAIKHTSTPPYASRGNLTWACAALDWLNLAGLLPFFFAANTSWAAFWREATKAENSRTAYWHVFLHPCSSWSFSASILWPRQRLTTALYAAVDTLLKLQQINHEALI